MIVKNFLGEKETMRAFFDNAKVEKKMEMEKKFCHKSEKVYF